jgi:hypothetical protein
VDEYALNHADDPDLQEIIAKKERDKENYLKWEGPALDGRSMFSVNDKLVIARRDAVSNIFS